ncbi:hypothetical protein [Nocardia puris]|uniref:hypothetical protein n=1 Tax=Nocardia puris TaxID=208602 RepID=UPI002E2329C4
MNHNDIHSASGEEGYHEIPPSLKDSYHRLHLLAGRIDEVTAATQAALERYQRVDPATATTDHFGAPIRPDDALAQVTAHVRAAAEQMDRARREIDQALDPASRLMLTGPAANQRDQLLGRTDAGQAPMSPRREITRDR